MKRSRAGRHRHSHRANDRGRVRVRTARGRKIGSTRWLDRQLNDPFVRMAVREGYRSRSAYKLIDLNERFDLIRPGMRVVDLGSSPGGWSQVAADLVKPETDSNGKATGRVVACDIREMDPVEGVDFLNLDMHSEEAVTRLKSACGGLVEVVLSDMAAPATGHARTDHLRVIALCETALDLACALLVPGGSFVAKVLEGGAGNDLQARTRSAFRRVRTVKPPASRKESSEKYLVASGYRAGERSM